MGCGGLTPIAGPRADPAPRPGSGPPSAYRTGVARPLGACATSRADRRPPGYQPERNSSSAAKSTTGSWVIASSSVSNAATLAAGKAARTAVKVRSMCGWGRSCHWTVMTTPNLLPLPRAIPTYRAGRAEPGSLCWVLTSSSTSRRSSRGLGFPCVSADRYWSLPALIAALISSWVIGLAQGIGREPGTRL